MSFERHIFSYLEDWKIKDNRKPLIIRGARQVGKTTAVKEFSKTYKYKILLNLERSADRSFFNVTDDVVKILESLFLSKNIPLKDVDKTLLFIDEIQENPKAIQLLRYFYEDLPALHVIAAGSLLEFALKDVKSFPVGRVEFLYMYPFNFAEFLNAIGHETALEQLNNIPISETAHKVLLELFNKFAILGGMPEVVKEYVKNNSIAGTNYIYESIWAAYIDDAEKYSRNVSSRNVIKHIMATAPYQVDKRIKYQNFGNSNYKSREVSEAFRNLDKAKVIQLVYPTTSIDVPIMPDFKKSPRLQFLDTGILNYILGITSELIFLDDLSNAYKGAIVPQIISQELMSIQSQRVKPLNFWVRDKKQASSEVDLVQQVGDKIIPIEIKSGATGSLKSLHQFVDRSSHPYAVRIYAGKFEVIETKTPAGTPYLLMNLPYYLGTKIPEYLDYFVENYSGNQNL